MFKFSVASTFQEPPVAKSSRPGDTIRYILYTLPIPRLFWVSAVIILVRSDVRLTSTWAISIFKDELGLYSQQVGWCPHSSAVRTGYCLEKCPFVRRRFGHRCQRKVLLFCNFMGLRKCELLININKIQVNHTIIVVLRAGDPSTRPSFTVINFLCFRALLGQSGLISKLFRNRSHLRKSKFVI